MKNTISLIMSMILYNSCDYSNPTISGYLHNFMPEETVIKIVSYIKVRFYKEIEGDFGKLLEILLTRIDLEDILFYENYNKYSTRQYDYLPFEKAFITPEIKLTVSIPVIINPIVQHREGSSVFNIDKDKSITRANNNEYYKS